MFELPSDTPADLVPLAWLIGVWEGTGVIDYASDAHRFESEFFYRASFSHDGGDFLNYSATAWIEGEPATPLVAETGFWRLARPATDLDAGPGLLPAPGASTNGDSAKGDSADSAPASRDSANSGLVDSAPVKRTAEDVEKLRTENGFEIEASIVHSDGVSELYLGRTNGPRVDLATDAVVRSASAKPYSAATRMYGLVEGHLLWAWDIAALGASLRSHASARLARAE